MAQATRNLTGVVITDGGGVAGATIQIKDKPLTATSGADGTFTLAKVPVTDLVVQVSAEGFNPVEVPVKAGRTATVFAVTLTKVAPPPPAPLRTVTVLVRDSATGAGLANATIKVQGTEITAQTDADGLFVLKDMAVADLILDISAADHNPSSVTVAAADSSTKIALTSTIVAVPEPAPAPPAPTLSDEELAALAEAEAEATAEGEGEIIVVTGSAIERKELTTVAPVSVVDKADLEIAGLSTVGDILQNLPAQSNGINAQANNGGDGSTRINLRGLGSNRTLTLINGRRVVPGGTGADASVDINAIPLAVIERVEVLKDGASAIYGSDAIGGVVNIITRQDMNGSEATIYTGTSTRGDGFGYDMSLVTGTSNKRGNVMFAAGYQNQEPVFAGDREYSTVDKRWDYEELEVIPSGSSATPNGRLSTSVAGGARDICGIGSNGRPIPACRREGNAWVPFSSPADLYNYQPENYLYTPSERYNVFTTGTYKVTDSVRAFFEGSYINRKSDQRLAPEPLFTTTAGIRISGASVYNPIGADVIDYRRRLVEFGPRRSLQNIDTFRFVTGLDGTVPESIPGLANWKWELSFNFGRTQATQRNEGNLIVSRLASALGPSFFDASGVARCGTPTDTIDGCVPMNVMSGADAKAITPEMIKYVTFTGVSSGYNRQQTVLGTMHGRLARTPWGGDIALAVGADYRREAGGATPDPLTSTGDTTGNAQEPTDGSYNVKEGYAELSAVPVVGKGAVQWLELNLAARMFDYSNFGSGLTWKAGGLFRTLGGVSFRGTYSTAFRAPNIGELFSGNADSFPAVPDPCDADNGPIPDVVQAQCDREGVPRDSIFGLTQQRSKVGGNPNLQEETANVLTGGIVVEPPMIKGLALTVDYFNVDIEGTIQSLGAGVILANCYQRGNQESCAKVKRNPSNFQIDYIDDVTDNVGGTKTSGIDFSVAYDHQYSFGRMRHSFEGTYLLDYDIDSLLAGEEALVAKGNYDFGVFPALKTNFTTTWAKDGISAGFNLRFVGSYDECNEDFGGCNALAKPDADGDGDEDEDDITAREVNVRTVDTSLTADIFAGYSMKSKAGVTTLGIGMNNVLDQDPPVIYSGFAGDSDSSAYDYMGRFVYARMSQQF
jgi:iron complex outermembrane receptor protein